ncbi:MAG: class I SAM-dependent RNA methyltransferase [Actinomycetota bacterium]
MSAARPSTSGRKRRLDAAAICAPGLEELCAAELTALGCKPKPSGPGVVDFGANARQLYGANVWLRTASRVVVRVATFRATDFAHLQEHASAIDWSSWVPTGHAPRFRVSTNASKLYHTKAVAQRLHQVSLPPSIGEPEQLFVVRIERNTVTISADASGEALHRRPWRADTGPAPLRPNLAAAMILAAGWDPTSDLVDPFCGAGTIGIEAALLAAGLPPGGERPFAFHDWPTFEPGSWASVVASIEASVDRAARDGRGTILLADRDQAAVDATEANAGRAGVADRVEVVRQVVSHLGARSGPGLAITNPPYGKRLGRDELGRLYARLGAVARERLPDHDLAVLTTDAGLARTADGRLRGRLRFRNGGLGVQLFHRPASGPVRADPGEPVADVPVGSDGPGTAAGVAVERSADAG